MDKSFANSHGNVGGFYNVWRVVTLCSLAELTAAWRWLPGIVHQPSLIYSYQEILEFVASCILPTGWQWSPHVGPVLLCLCPSNRCGHGHYVLELSFRVCVRSSWRRHSRPASRRLLVEVNTLIVSCALSFLAHFSIGCSLVDYSCCTHSFSYCFCRYFVSVLWLFPPYFCFPSYRTSCKYRPWEV